MDNNSLRAFYEKAHQFPLPFVTTEPTPFQLFLQEKMAALPHRESLIEWGCGQGANFSFLVQQNIFFKSMAGVDFAENAIKYAKAALPYPFVSLMNIDVSKECQLGKFEIQIDGHLWHCLIDDKERKAYLSNVLGHMVPGGQFIAETILNSKNAKFSPQYKQEKDVIWQNLSGEWRAVRRVKKAYELEAELLEHGFKILYFVVSPGACYYLSDESLKNGPTLTAGPFDVLRVIVTR